MCLSVCVSVCVYICQCHCFSLSLVKFFLLDIHLLEEVSGVLVDLGLVLVVAHGVVEEEDEVVGEIRQRLVLSPLDLLTDLRLIERIETN